MDLPDINVLVSAFRPDSPHHRVAKEWLESVASGAGRLLLFPVVEAGFLRIVTHPGIFSPPSPPEEAREFLRVLCASPHVDLCPWTVPAREQWFTLAAGLGLRGNDLNDAMLAAAALDRRLRLVTFDQGFRRFPGLAVRILAG